MGKNTTLLILVAAGIGAGYLYSTSKPQKMMPGGNMMGVANLPPEGKQAGGPSESQPQNTSPINPTPGTSAVIEDNKLQQGKTLPSQIPVIRNFAKSRQF